MAMSVSPSADRRGQVVISAKRAAVSIAAERVRGRAISHFNGKIEAPTIYAAAEPDETAIAARWDFSIGISTTQVEDVGPSDLHGELVNLPARGMTGVLWDDSEQCWRHAPEHYGRHPLP